MAITIADDSPPDFTFDLGGSMYLRLISTTSTEYELEFKDTPTGMDDYEFTVKRADFDDTSGNVDPGKVLLWLLKKAKEAICPTCK